MTKPHITLRPNTNILLIIVWGTLCSFLFMSNPIKPILILTIGAILGGIGGIMQTLGFNEAKASFVNASTMIEVRKRLKETKWGKWYIYFLWSSNISLILIALKFTNTHNPFTSILIGYFALMFVRELITLKITYKIKEQ